MIIPSLRKCGILFRVDSRPPFFAISGSVIMSLCVDLTSKLKLKKKKNCVREGKRKTMLKDKLLMRGDNELM